jgi:hypothetical protein
MQANYNYEDVPVSILLHIKQSNVKKGDRNLFYVSRAVKLHCFYLKGNF